MVHKRYCGNVAGRSSNVVPPARVIIRIGSTVDIEFLDVHLDCGSYKTSSCPRQTGLTTCIPIGSARKSPEQRSNNGHQPCIVLPPVYSTVVDNSDAY